LRQCEPWGEEKRKIVKGNFMNAAQVAIIEREFNGKAPDDPKVKARVADLKEKEASVQGQNAQLRDGLKDKRREIAKLNEDIKALQAAAEKHHLRCKMVYTEVKTQAMWSDSKVPKEDIKDFPELPHALREAAPKKSSAGLLAMEDGEDNGENSDTSTGSM